MGNLLDNLDKVRADEDWSDYSDNVVEFIRRYFDDLWSVSEIERSIGILRTNAYSVEAGDPATHGLVRILFPRLSLMYEHVKSKLFSERNYFSNHSCSANSQCIVQDDFSMKVLTVEDVGADEEITISYLPTVFMTLPERRRKIQKTWFFACNCKR